MIREITDNDPDLAAAMGASALAGLDDELGRSNYATFPLICQDIFAGISRMGALAMKKYGPSMSATTADLHP